MLVIKLGWLHKFAAFAGLGFSQPSFRKGNYVCHKTSYINDWWINSIGYGHTQCCLGFQLFLQGSRPKLMKDNPK